MKNIVLLLFVLFVGLGKAGEAPEGYMVSIPCESTKQLHKLLSIDPCVEREIVVTRPLNSHLKVINAKRFNSNVPLSASAVYKLKQEGDDLVIKVNLPEQEQNRQQ